MLARSKSGIACSRSPSAKMITLRRRTFATMAPRGAFPARRRPRASGMATPTMNRKNGKIRSVGVQPCHSACRSGGYTARQVPGLLTSTMAATVMPRNASSDTSRPAAAGPGASGVTLPRAGRPRRLREGAAHRCVGLERAPQAELLADLAQGGEHFLAEEADARARVLVGDEAVAGPEAHDRRPRLLQQAAELRDDRLRRAGDDLLVLELILEGGAPRIRPPSHRVLDEGRAVRGREVTGRARPDGVREAGELALHPHELAGVGERLLFGLRDVAP